MERNISLDVLKLSMAFMVVGLHSRFLSDHTPLGSHLLANGLFRIAVPIFLIINGFYFFATLRKSGEITWLKRVLILYIAWMLFYSYFWLSNQDFSLFGIAAISKTLLLGYHHLWYISGMIAAAVLLITVHRLSTKFVASSALLAFFIGALIQYVGNYIYFDNRTLDELFDQNWTHRNAIFLSYPFFCIGYLIRKHKIYDRVPLHLVGIICAISIFMLISESWVNFYKTDGEGGFDNYFFLIVTCPFIFIYFIKLKLSGNSKRIALYSTAIFLIHPLFISILRKFTEIEATLLTIITLLMSILAAYFIVKLNDKFKYFL